MPFAIWDGAWYGGHHLPSYSVLFPPLGWLLGPAVVAAVAAVAAAAAFAALAEAHFGPGARPGAWWFATLGTASELFAGRLTFTLGLAIGLASLLALQRGRVLGGTGLAVATGLASTVAALFLGLACGALALSRLPGRSLASVTRAAAPGAAALATALLLFLLFPEGGREPLYRAFFITTIGMTAALAMLLPRRVSGALVIGTLVYAAGTIASFKLTTPVGSNVARLGSLLAGPLLACALLSARSSVRLRAPLAAGLAAYALWAFPPWFELGALLGAGLLLVGLLRRPTAPLWGAGAMLALLPFAIWQWSQTTEDLRHAASDHSTRASYFRPLLAFLDRADRPRAWRVEVPAMREHWESVEVASHFPLARGWERQLDTRYASLFYHPHASRRFHAWLEENDVRFVAVPDAPLDYATGREIATIRRRPRYLRPLWRSAHWRVYQVTPTPRFVDPAGGARITGLALGPRRVVLLARTRGTAIVRVRYTRYWRLRGGCVGRSGDWTRVTARRTGVLSLSIAVSIDRLLPWSGVRCD